MNGMAAATNANGRNWALIAAAGIACAAAVLFTTPASAQSFRTLAVADSVMTKVATLVQRPGGTTMCLDASIRNDTLQIDRAADIGSACTAPLATAVRLTDDHVCAPTADLAAEFRLAPQILRLAVCGDGPHLLHGQGHAPAGG